MEYLGLEGLVLVIGFTLMVLVIGFTLMALGGATQPYVKPPPTVAVASIAILYFLERSEGSMSTAAIVRTLAGDPHCPSCRAAIDAAIRILTLHGQVELDESLDAEVCRLTDAGRRMVTVERAKHRGIRPDAIPGAAFTHSHIHRELEQVGSGR